MTEDEYKKQLQQIADDSHIKIYRYVLENGNRFSTPTPAAKGEKIGGSKVEKLIEVIKPTVKE